MKALIFENGDQMPAIGLGTWKSTPGEVYEAVLEAIRIGYRHIDCAYIYANENEVGEAIQQVLSEGLIKREDLWITSKLWNAFHKKEDVEFGLEESLKSLKLDYLDLYLIHWPVATVPGKMLPENGADFVPLDQAPLINTWEEMIRLKKSGRIKHIGVSNFSQSKIQDLIDKSGIAPEMNQVERHAYFQQESLINYCHDKGIHVTCYSPLGSPDRPEFLKKSKEPSLLQNENLVAQAGKNNISPAQALIAWTITKGLAVIPKSVNPERIRQNFESKDIVLSEEDIHMINSLEKGYRYIDGSLWAQPGSPYTIEELWA